MAHLVLADCVCSSVSCTAASGAVDLLQLLYRAGTTVLQPQQQQAVLPCRRVAASWCVAEFTPMRPPVNAQQRRPGARHR